MNAEHKHDLKLKSKIELKGCVYECSCGLRIMQVAWDRIIYNVVVGLPKEKKKRT